MTLDKVTLETVQDLSRAEARSMRDVLRNLVAEAVAARHRNGGVIRTPAPQVQADSMNGRMVSAYLPGQTRFALAELANRERRSVSATMKLLVREGLIQRGVLQAVGNDKRQ